MRGRWVARGVCFALWLLFAGVACTYTPALMGAQSNSTVTPEPAVTPAPDGFPIPEISEFPAPGQVVVLGEDANLYLLQRGHTPLALTSDGRPFNEVQGGQIYTHPTWSRNGWLSFARVSIPSQGDLSLDVLAVRPGESDPITLWSTQEGGYIYGYWSPLPCTNGPDCGRFAFLMDEGDTIALHLAEVNSENSIPISESILDRAQPFYYSWSPDGESMLWFQNSQSLLIYDVEEHEVRARLADSPGLFQAPAWSPVDQRLLFTRSEAEGSVLTIAEGDTRAGLGLPLEGAVFFSWSPDGEHIGYASGTFPLSAITVIDDKGNIQHIIEDIENVVAFFWSPDSSQLAVVSLEAAPEPLPEAHEPGLYARRFAQRQTPDFVLVWSVVSLATGESRRLATFLPTREQFYILQFFDQFSQSHRVWSPDSRYLVYAEQSAGVDRGLVRLIDTTQPGLSPWTLMEGRQAVFSFED